MEYIISTTIYLLKGTYTTLNLYFVTALFSMPLSMLFAALQFSAPKFIRYIFDIYAWIFRGTPLILQLIFFYYGLPLMTNNLIAFPAFTSAAITFILNYSAYLNLVKDTALVIVLGIGDLMLHAREILTRDFKLLPFVIAGIIYLAFTSVLVLIFRRLEKKYVIRN